MARILFVEDEEAVLKRLLKYFEREGFEVRVDRIKIVIPRELDLAGKHMAFEIQISIIGRIGLDQGKCHTGGLSDGPSRKNGISKVEVTKSICG